jgi:hypothetical protein
VSLLADIKFDILLRASNTTGRKSRSVAQAIEAELPAAVPVPSLNPYPYLISPVAPATLAIHFKVSGASLIYWQQ